MGKLKAESNVVGHLVGDIFDESEVAPELLDVLLKAVPPYLSRVAEVAAPVAPVETVEAKQSKKPE